MVRDRAEGSPDIADVGAVQDSAIVDSLERQGLVGHGILPSGLAIDADEQAVCALISPALRIFKPVGEPVLGDDDESDDFEKDRECHFEHLPSSTALTVRSKQPDETPMLGTSTWLHSNKAIEAFPIWKRSIRRYWEVIWVLLDAPSRFFSGTAE